MHRHAQAGDGLIACAKVRPSTVQKLKLELVNTALPDATPTSTLVGHVPPIHPPASRN